MTSILGSIPLASVYRLNGANFRASAEKLARDIDVDERGCPKKLTAIPMFYLASHAAELYLKAALLKRGVTDTELRKSNIRHNLTGLMDLLLSQNVRVTPQTVKIIKGLSEQHREHALRYSVLLDASHGKKTYWPPITKVFTSLDELLLLTRTTATRTNVY